MASGCISTLSLARIQQGSKPCAALSLCNQATREVRRARSINARTAAHLCDAEMAFIFRREGEFYRLAANSGFSPEYERFVKNLSISPGRGSVTGRTALEGRVVHITDMTDDPEYDMPETLGLGKARTLLGVPLLRENVPIGVISLARQRVEPFTEKQIELVSTFADQAVIAIENVRLFEAEQQRTRELSESLEQQTATSDILRVISSSPTDVQPIFDAIVRSASRLCGGEYAIVTRFDGELLHLAAQHNPRPGTADATANFFPQVPSRETSMTARAL